MGLVADGNRFMATINYDGEGGPYSGLEDVDGRNIVKNPKSHIGPVIPAGRRSTIVYTVREKHIQVTCNGKTVVDWRGEPSRLTTQRWWNTILKADGLYLGTLNCLYRIHSATLVPLK